MEENIRTMSLMLRQICWREKLPASSAGGYEVIFLFVYITHRDITTRSYPGYFFRVEDGDSISRYMELSVVGESSLTQPCVDSNQQFDLDAPLIAVMMSRDIAVIASILAILKCGAVFVPVDPTFPPDRQSYIFENSKCMLLVADRDSYDQTKNSGTSLPPSLIVDLVTVEVLEYIVPSGSSVGTTDNDLFDAKQWMADRLAARRSAQVDGGGLAYVLYTSGSTGKPKGVMVKQEGVLNVVDYFAAEVPVHRGSRVLGLTTLCFDISVLELFLPLLNGGTLVLAHSATQRNPYRLLQYMTEASVDIMQATPTTYEMMLATGWTGDASMDFLVSVL